MGEIVNEFKPREMVNKLIVKYIEYVPAILELNSDELRNLCEKSDEEAREYLGHKQEEIQKMELKKDRCPVTYYSQSNF